MMYRLRFVLPLFLLFSGGCVSSAFSRISAGHLTRQDDGHRLTVPVEACGLTFPSESTLWFPGGDPRWGVQRARLGADTMFGNQTLVVGTEIEFDSEPKKLFSAERCDVLVLRLMAPITFGTNTFGPSDRVVGRGVVDGWTPTRVTLGAARTVAGTSYQQGDELTLAEDGSVTRVRTASERTQAEARANAHQREVDAHRQECNTRCAPYTGRQRADCINQCL